MLDLSLFENPFANIFILQKWNWDYLEAEQLQLDCVEYVNKNPHVCIFIICSHESCFTMGRGLQKMKDSSCIQLVDFDNKTNLLYPLHQIKRGGGLTFHYPGQLVFYPIINLTFHKMAVHDFMITIMEITKTLLEKYFSLSDFKIRTDLLGLWFENSGLVAKVASIGLASSKFTTYHGMALNFFNDQEMFNALIDLYPCGLSGSTYIGIESICQKVITENDREIFAQSFKEQLTNLFQNNRQ